MHAYIVAGGSQKERSDYIHHLLDPSKQLIHLTSEKTTITIQQVRELLATLGITSPKPRLVWIQEAQQLTLPAQNALLKVLEEPPKGITLYLTCSAAQSLLPTIRSRCQVITLQTPPAMNTDRLSSLKEVMSLSPGDRLVSIVKRDRAESIEWIRAIVVELKAKLADPQLTPSGYTLLAKVARLALDAHSQLSANCSVSLVTQNFLLKLPKTK